MKLSKDINWGIVVIALAIGAVYIAMQISKPVGIVPFANDFPAAQKQAAASGKPLFLDFTATWCGPCQSLKSTTWADKRVAAELSKYVAVSVDIDQHPDLARQYHVDSIPAFIVIDPGNGAILKENRQGALPPDAFLDWLGE